MTLTLSAPQQVTLRSLGRSDTEPLFFASFITGLTQRFSVATPTAGQTLTVEGNSSGSTSISFSASHLPDSGFAGIGADAAETAGRAAETFRALGVDAWARGTELYVRVDGASDTSLTTSGSSLTGGTVVEVGTPTGPTYEFVSGSRTLEGYPASLVEVDAAGQEKSRPQNEVKKSRRGISLRWDPITEDMVLRQPLQGRTVIITRGTAETPVADWIPSGVYVVTDGPYPDELGMLRGDFGAGTDFPYDERPTFELELMDRTQYYLERRQNGLIEGDLQAILPQHPLEHVQQLLRVFLTGSEDTAPPTDIVDETTLDPTDAAWSDVSHLAVCRTDIVVHADSPVTPELLVSGGRNGSLSRGVQVYRDSENNEQEYPRLGYYALESELDKATADELLEDVLMILPGQLMAEEDGITRARRIDYSTIAAGTATIRDWSSRFVPSGLTEMKRDAFTRVLVAIGETVGGGDFDDFWRRSYALQDDASASAHRTRGLTALLNEVKVESKLLNQIGYLQRGVGGDTLGGDLNPRFPALVASDTALRVSGFGFAGSRADPQLLAPQVTIPPSWAQPSADRRVYLRLESPPLHWRADFATATGTRSGGFEVIECDGVTFDSSTTALRTPWIGSSRLDRTDERWVFHTPNFQIRTRAFAGETPGAWIPGCPVTDITYARILGRQYLDPFSWGFPNIEGTTSLDQLDVQIGDFVSVPLPHMLDFGGVGATQLQLVFEVLGKQERETDVEWLLGLAYRGEPFFFQAVEPPPFTVYPTPGALTPVEIEEPRGTAQANTSVSIATAEAGPIVRSRILSTVSTTGSEGTPSIPSTATPSGTNVGLVVFITAHDSGGSPGGATSVEYGGQPLTELQNQTGTNVTAQAFVLEPADLASASGSAFVVTGTAGAHAVEAYFVEHVRGFESDGATGSTQQASYASPNPEGSLAILATVVDDSGGAAAAQGSLLSNVAFDSSSAAMTVVTDELLDFAAEAEASFSGGSEQAGASVLVRSTLEGGFDLHGFSEGWDATDAPGTPGDLPAFDGSLDMPLVSGSYTTGNATGGFSELGIGAGRVGAALASSASSSPAVFTLNDSSLEVPATEAVHLRCAFVFAPKASGNGRVAFMGLIGVGACDVISRAAGLLVQYWDDTTVRAAASVALTSGDVVALDYRVSPEGTAGGTLRAQLMVNGTDVADFESPSFDYTGIGSRRMLLHLNGADNAEDAMISWQLRRGAAARIDLEGHRQWAASVGAYTP